MRTRRLPTIAVLIAAGALIGACGGGDDGSADEGDQSSADETDGGRDSTPVVESDGGESDGGSDVPGCDEIFPIAEIEAWFGEPAEVTEEFVDSLGQRICTWETIEDLDDLEDLAYQLITAQVFTGDPAPAAGFVDPEFYDDITMLDGPWDLAFADESFGSMFNFLDEPVAGSFSYSDVDVGDPDAPKRHTRDEVEAMFRDFHARIAG